VQANRKWGRIVKQGGTLDWATTGINSPKTKLLIPACFNLSLTGPLRVISVFPIYQHYPCLYTLWWPGVIHHLAPLLKLVGP